MHRSVLTSIITVTALAFCAAIVSPAEARKRGKKKQYSSSEARPLTVRKRSFLDSGKHPLRGETNLYMTQGTRYNVMPYDYSGRYGSSVLPGSLGPFFPR
jgi:hypothetical protein